MTQCQRQKSVLSPHFLLSSLKGGDDVDENVKSTTSPEVENADTHVEDTETTAITLGGAHGDDVDDDAYS